MNLLSSMDIVKKSIALYKANLDLFAEYVKLLFLPSAATVIGMGFLEFFKATLPPAAALFFLFLVILPPMLFSLLITIMLIQTIADRYEGRDGRHPKILLHDAVKLLWPSILASLLNGLAVLGGFLLFLIPGIIFSIWFVFAMYVVVLENERGVKALVRSKALVQGRWWPVAVRLGVPGILFGILIFAVQGIVSIPANMLLGTMTEGTAAYLFVTIVLGLFTTGITVFLSPLPTAAQVILFLELKRTSLPATTPDHPTT